MNTMDGLKELPRAVGSGSSNLAASFHEGSVGWETIRRRKHARGGSSFGRWVGPFLLLGLDITIWAGLYLLVSALFDTGNTYDLAELFVPAAVLAFTLGLIGGYKSR